MKNSETKNGIIYCRVSSIEQIDGTSLESQQRMCEEYSLREGIEVLKIFIERGESAKTANRTEFLKAIAYCSDKKNKVDYFIVYKIDRFARNQTDHMSVQQVLRKYNVKLRSVTEPINESSTGKLMEGILSSFAEFDNSIRTERSVNGMKERIKHGIWVWQAPLGYYRTEKGANITPDPKLAPYIKLAFEEYVKGTYTFKSLANFLNKRGFVTRHNNKATPQLIEKIIKNPLYCGIIKVWDMEHKGTFETIINEDLFYQCQNDNKNRNVPHLTKNPNFPLRKLAVCQFCGEHLTGSSSTGNKGKKYPYYHHHKQTCSYAKFIPKENFEQIFVEYLQEINPNLKYEKAFKAIVMDIWKNNCQNFNNENEKVMKDIKVLEQSKQRVFELHQSGVYTDEDFVFQKNIINRKIAEKKLLIHDKAIEEFNMGEALEYCFNFIRNTANTWIGFKNEPEKRLRFQKLIFDENIQFSGEKFGTTKLTPIYSIYHQYLINPSTLVTLQRIEL